MIRARRIGDGPIVHSGLCDSIGTNINGPSLIETPNWAPRRLGRFLLYFSDHAGSFIRLAFADRIEGPWAIHRPGVLHLHQTDLAQEQPDLPQPDWAVAEGVNGLYPHLASPDVTLDHDARRFTMLFHGLDLDGWQRSLMAVSPDGLDWTVLPGRISDDTYLRRFRLQGQDRAVALGARLHRLRGDGTWQSGPLLAAGTHRHPAPLVLDDRLYLISHRIGDTPERMVSMEVDTSGSWLEWRAGQASDLLTPDLPWEGGALAIEPSRTGGAYRPVRQLRDPCAVQLDGRVFMVYAGAGEAALGLAELTGF